jgi:hypothetical protein
MSLVRLINSMIILMLRLFLLWQTPSHKLLNKLIVILIEKMFVLNVLLYWLNSVFASWVVRNRTCMSLLIWNLMLRLILAYTANSLKSIILRHLLAISAFLRLSTIILIQFWIVLIIISLWFCLIRQVWCLFLSCLMWLRWNWMSWQTGTMFLDIILSKSVINSIATNMIACLIVAWWWIPSISITIDPLVSTNVCSSRFAYSCCLLSKLRV